MVRVFTDHFLFMFMSCRGLHYVIEVATKPYLPSCL